MRGDTEGGAAGPGDGSWSLGDGLRDALRLLEVATGDLLVAAAALLALGGFAGAGRVVFLTGHVHRRGRGAAAGTGAGLRDPRER